MGQGVLLDWTGVLIPAEKELSEEEIDVRYGTLMRSAVSAFQVDPTYVVNMAESAAQIKYNRALTLARQEAAKQTSDKTEIREIAREIMEDQGLYPPTRSEKRGRTAA